MAKKCFSLFFVALFTSILFGQNVELTRKSDNAKSAALHEITKTDFISSAKQLKSSNISVIGIDLRTIISELLSNFHKSTDDFYQNIDEPYRIELEEAIRIYTKDKTVIKYIEIIDSHIDGDGGYEAHKMFAGETLKFFELRSYDEFTSFLLKNVGKPKYIYHNKNELIEEAEFYYSNGFVFEWFNGLHANSVSIKIVLEDELEKVAIEHKAKTFEENKKIESEPIPTSKHGLRHTLWGMSKEEVRKNENMEFVSEHKGDGGSVGLEIIMYKSKINSLNFMVGYFFANNRLTRARYIMSNEHTNYNSYIADYYDMKNAISTQYGPSPTLDDPIWADDLYKDNPDAYGMAVSTGHLRYASLWETQETSIQLLLKGDNYKIDLLIDYIGKAFIIYEKSITDKAKKGLW
jgi:hypothetical protein